jgi:hypothetical protein
MSEVVDVLLELHKMVEDKLIAEFERLVNWGDDCPCENGSFVKLNSLDYGVCTECGGMVDL